MRSGHDSIVLHRRDNRYGILLASSAAEPYLAQCSTLVYEPLLSNLFGMRLTHTKWNLDVLRLKRNLIIFFKKVLTKFDYYGIILV